MSLTSYGERVRFRTLKLGLSVAYHLHTTGLTLRRLGDRVRTVSLVLALMLIYFFLVSPMGLRGRREGVNVIADEWRGRMGWYTNVQSTSDLITYSSLSSPQVVRALSQENSGFSIRLLNKALMSLRWLAKPPREKEVSPDLYVMF